MPGLIAGHDRFSGWHNYILRSRRGVVALRDRSHADGRIILIEFLSQETAMKTTKAMIIVAALAIATFMIGVGKYNAQYADARHSVSQRHTA